MIKNLYVLDERDVWHRPLIEAARAKGWNAGQIFTGQGANLVGYGFIRPHAQPDRLARNRDQDDVDRRRSLRMIQDRAQVEVYEDKSEQFRRWGHLMPDTWLINGYGALEQFYDVVDDLPLPIVSKANEGASSYNVRVIQDREALCRHAEAVFRGGVPVKCCAGGRGVGDTIVTQRDYLLLQRFVPHDVTWRVNVVGSKLAIFKRYCYPDRPVAQTGNVEPVKVLDAETESLLRWSVPVFQELGTRWCAIDVLYDHEAGRWALLETSLAWPWPSPGDCDNGVFFDYNLRQLGAQFWPTTYQWRDMMRLLVDELEAGVFDDD